MRWSGGSKWHPDDETCLGGWVVTCLWVGVSSLSCSLSRRSHWFLMMVSMVTNLVICLQTFLGMMAHSSLGESLVTSFRLISHLSSISLIWHPLMLAQALKESAHSTPHIVTDININNISVGGQVREGWVSTSGLVSVVT